MTSEYARADEPCNNPHDAPAVDAVERSVRYEAVITELSSKLDEAAEEQAQLLNDIAVMMSEFVDNWPQPKKVSTALALIAKTLRAAMPKRTDEAERLKDLLIEAAFAGNSWPQSTLKADEAAYEARQILNREVLHSEQPEGDGG